MKDSSVHKRDLRIDFFRGVALLVMGVDHTEMLAGVQALSFVTYAPIGVSTAAELFIFLSGYVFGLVFQRVYMKRGFFMVQMRSLYRAWQLYSAHLLSLVLTVAAVGVISQCFDGDANAARSKGVIHVTESMLYKFATFQTCPVFFDILPLYILFIGFLPIFFKFFDRSFTLGLVLSGLLYVVVQYIAYSYGPDRIPFTGTLYYNPFAWQFLFVIGMALGVKGGSGRSVQSLSRAQLITALIILLLVGIWYKIVRLNVLMVWFGAVQYSHSVAIPFDVPGIDKSMLGPIRLLHFLVVALVVRQLLPIHLQFWQSRAANPLVTCGQNALEVFVAGVVLNYSIATYMEIHRGGREMVVVLDVVFVILSVLFAYLVEWIKGSPWRTT